MIKAVVTVMPKSSILDPQGEAVNKAIQGMGMSCVKSARVGKTIRLDIEGSDLEKTRTKLEDVAKNLLSNPVVEDYLIEIALAD